MPEAPYIVWMNIKYYESLLSDTSSPQMDPLRRHAIERLLADAKEILRKAETQAGT